MLKLNFVNKTAEFKYFINFPLVFSRKILSLWRELKIMDAMLIGRVQIDLLIDRSDGIIDVCEMKYSKDSYVITSDYASELTRKRNVFQSVTGTKKAIHSIMVTTDGLTRNEYWSDVQAEIKLDDLYEL